MQIRNLFTFLKYFNFLRRHIWTIC